MTRRTTKKAPAKKKTPEPEPEPEVAEEAEAEAEGEGPRMSVALHLRSGKVLHYECGVDELEESLVQWRAGKYSGSGSDPGRPLRMILANQGSCEALDARALDANSIGMVALPPDLVGRLTPLVLALAARSKDEEDMVALGELADLLREAAPDVARGADEAIAKFAENPLDWQDEMPSTIDPAPAPQKASVCPSCGHTEAKPDPDIDGLMICTACRMAGSVEAFCAG